MEIQFDISELPYQQAVVSLVFETESWEEQDFYRYSDSHHCVQSFTGDEVALLKQKKPVENNNWVLVENNRKVLNHARPGRFIFNEILKMNDGSRFKLNILKDMLAKDLQEVDLICSILQCLKESHLTQVNI